MACEHAELDVPGDILWIDPNSKECSTLFDIVNKKQLLDGLDKLSAFTHTGKVPFQFDNLSNVWRITSNA